MNMAGDLQRLILLFTLPEYDSEMIYRAHLPANHRLESDIDDFLLEMGPSIALQITKELHRLRGALKFDLLLATDVFSDMI